MTVSIKKLKEVATINPRRPSIERADDVMTSFVPMENVDEVMGAVATLSSEPFSKIKKGYTYFEDGDVIFAKITPCMQNGKHAVLSGLIDGFGFGSTEFHVIRPGKGISSEWIHSFLRRKETLNAAMNTFTGAVGQQRVPESFLEEIEIPLPDPDVQNRIVASMEIQLAEVETARRAAVSQLQDAALLKSTALQSIFSGISNRQAIGSVAGVQSGYAFKSDTFKASGVRLLRNTNILPGRVYWDDRVFLSEEESTPFKSYELNDGDVLISLDRPIISSGIKVARVGALDLPALLVQRVGRFLIDADQLDADYLYAYLQTQMFISAVSGHDQSLGVPHISPTQVENVEIPLPDVTTQKKLSRQLNEIAREWQVIRSAIQAQLNDLTTLPNAILAQAFES